MPEQLQAKNELERVLKFYEEDPRTKSFNALIIGDYGTGKTTLLETARKPVLIHSFDPGGTKSINPELIKSRQVIPDTRFESEKDSFKLWCDELVRLEQAKVFDQLGTFVIDSITSLFDALIKHIIKVRQVGAKVTEDEIRIQDWGTILNKIKSAIYECCAKPCDFITIGHIGIERDEILGKNETCVMLAGQSKHKIPLWFDEVYIAQANSTAKGTEYRLLTQNDGYYKARTRLGRGGKFERYEKPDIKGLLKKAGYSTEDKPIDWLSA